MTLTSRDLQALAARQVLADSVAESLRPALAARQVLADSVAESLRPALAVYRQQMWLATQAGEAIMVQTANPADELVPVETSAIGAPGVRSPITILALRVLLAAIVECLIIVVWQEKNHSPEDALLNTFFVIATWWQLDDALWKWLSR
jgi:hypothetical protein